MSTAITEYNPIEVAIAELKDLYSATVWVVDTPERMAAAKTARGEIRKWRLDLEAERKRIKGPALARCKEIDIEAKRITAEILALEEPVDTAIKEVEQAKKHEEAVKARLEEERVARYRAEVDRIRGIPLGAVGYTVAQLEKIIATTEATDVSHLDEFAVVAGGAIHTAIAKLRELRNEAQGREDEQGRLASERAELELLRRKQDAREEKDREAEAKARAERETENHERRVKLEAAEKAAHDRIAEEQKQAWEARERADAEARELRAKQETESRKAREAEETRLREERERVKAEREKAEAEERERQAERNKLLDGHAMLEAFVDRFGDMPEFSVVVGSIRSYLAVSET